MADFLRRAHVADRLAGLYQSLAFPMSTDRLGYLLAFGLGFCLYFAMWGMFGG